MRTTDFDFVLPKELIALQPSPVRDRSRLLVLGRSGSLEHRNFYDIAEYLEEGDMLLLNDTKVFPARIVGSKPSGGTLDLLLVKEADGSGVWEALFRGSYCGVVTVLGDVRAEIWREAGGGKKGRGALPPKGYIRFPHRDLSRIHDLLWRHGSMPLPPYIKREPREEDKERYQTVYAARQGSIAAPTAGLHFTEELLSRIRDKGVVTRTLTLHVGTGTFKPVKAEFLADHTMDPEYFEMDAALPEEIRTVKGQGGRLITVGTTATRAIEGYLSGEYTGCAPGADRANGVLCGSTRIFIYPGYRFRAVDCLLTNFHLPGSTPLMLASALAGAGNIRNAYENAVTVRYRFFSYGDAMLIL